MSSPTSHQHQPRLHGPNPIARLEPYGRETQSEQSDSAYQETILDDNWKLTPQTFLHLRGRQRWSDLPLQPESRPILQEELVAEVKRVLAAPAMVELKCARIISLANDHTDNCSTVQCQALVALHRTLLYEHHDFLAATTYSPATWVSPGLGAKYHIAHTETHFPATWVCPGLATKYHIEKFSSKQWQAFLALHTRKLYEQHNFLMATKHPPAASNHPGLATKCSISAERMGNEQWQALATLHKKKIYEHHDFLMVSKHSSAASDCPGLATKYTIPAQKLSYQQGRYLATLHMRRVYEHQDFFTATRHVPAATCIPELASKHSRKSSSATPAGKALHRVTDPAINGRLQGINISAFPDTGASSNFISERYAQLHGFPIDHSSKSQVKVGNGAKISIIGTVQLPFHFVGESKIYDLVFNVLRRSLHDVILGSPFLHMTQTLTRFTGRIESQLRQELDGGAYKMCLLGSHQYVSGMVNGITVNAVPDTGAEVSVMSAAFARANGFTVNTGEQNQVLLGFADCSTAQALGVVQDVAWNYGRDKKSHLTDVYVLADLSIDLVLGNDFLSQTNAFVEHESDFWHVENDGRDESFMLNLIKVMKACAKGRVREYRR